MTKICSYGKGIEPAPYLRISHFQGVGRGGSIEEGRRQEAEGRIQKGIQTPIEFKPLNRILRGLRKGAPSGRQKVRAILEGTYSFCPLPSAFLVELDRLIAQAQADIANGNVKDLNEVLRHG